MESDNIQSLELPAPGAKALNAISRDCLRRQELFLVEFEKHGIVSKAAADAGIPLGTVEYWDSQDTHGFKSRKASSARVAQGVLEAEVHRRAVLGYERPIVYKGVITGSTVEYSDNLLMFRLKRLEPQYRDSWVAPAQAPVQATQINVHLHPGVSGRDSALEPGVSPDIVE